MRETLVNFVVGRAHAHYFLSWPEICILLGNIIQRYIVRYFTVAQPAAMKCMSGPKTQARHVRIENSHTLSICECACGLATPIHSYTTVRVYAYVYVCALSDACSV